MTSSDVRFLPTHSVQVKSSSTAGHAWTAVRAFTDVLTIFPFSVTVTKCADRT
ncbi:MAG: hypothetical protein SCH66_14920 [Methanolobus sp.]|nr:hypothetical protein [Methanolobus sp.]